MQGRSYCASSLLVISLYSFLTETQTSETGLLTRAPTARLKRNKRRKSSDWGSQPGTYAAGLGIMNRWRLISHEWAHSLSCTFSGLCSLLTTTSAFQYYTLSVPTSDSAQTNQPERNLGLQKLHKSIRFCLKRWDWRLCCTTDELRVDWAGSLRTGFPRDVGETLAPSTIWISLISNSW